MIDIFKKFAWFLIGCYNINMKFPKIKFPWKKDESQVADFRLIFMGSGEFAVPSLKQLLDFERLLSSGKIVLAVFTQPDRPVGRSKGLRPTPIKELAKKYKVPVLEPVSLKSEVWIKKIQGLKPDLIVVCDYGILVPSEILDIPKFGTINIHPSLLPKYRGSTPIQQAILAGAEKTGVTIMLLDEKLDHGPILMQRRLKIKQDDTYLSLRTRLGEMGTDMLLKFLPNYLNGKFSPKAQDHKKATMTRELSKDDGRVDWQKSAAEIGRMQKAFILWPGIWTKFDGKILKLRVKKCEGRKNCKVDKQAKPGTVSLTGKRGELAVACGQGMLLIDELQVEGGRMLGSGEFLRGYGKIVGTVLG